MYNHKILEEGRKAWLYKLESIFRQYDFALYEFLNIWDEKGNCKEENFIQLRGLSEVIHSTYLDMLETLELEVDDKDMAIEVFESSLRVYVTTHAYLIMTLEGMPNYLVRTLEEWKIKKY